MTVASRLAISSMLACAVLAPAPAAGGEPSVRFNEHLFDGFGRQLDLADPSEVFRTVFAALADEVTVHPTENYYYFRLEANGRTIAGNLRLDAADRDDGVIHIGYFEYDEAGTVQDREGNGRAFAAADGVSVARLERFLYAVTAHGRTVRFRLNDRGREPPPDGLLRPQEIYVGRVQDESGLAFFLVFQEPGAHFMYLLDEREAVPETFVDGPPEVLIGRRTGFAFLDDRQWGRKVLIGVHARNTERNNYYDGPFDQLPDNHVEESGIGTLIELAYPALAGRIDGFGHYLADPGGRVAITPYYVYSTRTELGFVGSCRASEVSPAAFYACVTPDFQQMMMTGPTAAAAATESQATGQSAPAASSSGVPAPAVLGEGILRGRVRHQHGR